MKRSFCENFMVTLTLTALCICVTVFSAFADSFAIHCENAISQQLVNLCAQKKAEESDAELEEALSFLHENLSAAEQKQLILEQNNWQQQRTCQCSDEVRSELGLQPDDSLPSLFPEMYANCLQRKSDERQEVLKDKLQQRSTVISTAEVVK